MDDSPYGTSDHDLLAAFVTQGEEGAFEQIVRRYLSLVHGSAIRRTGDSCLAEEVTQNVFTLLAEKSRDLTGHPTLGGWLAKTAAFESMRLSRNEQTRKRKMKEYQREQTQEIGETAEVEPEWTAALPLLNDALASLPDSDRDAVVLRFYEKRNFKAIAGLLGKGDDACQKQVSRAVEKLSTWFRQHGVVLSSGAIIAGLSVSLGNSSAKAAAGLSASITSNAILAGNTSHTAAATTGGTILAATMKAKLLTTGFLLAALALSAGGGWLAGRSTRAPVSANLPDLDTPFKSAEANQADSESDASNDAREQSLRTLLETARREIQGNATHNAAKIRASARLSFIRPADLPEAMEVLATFDGGLYRNRELAGLLLERWANFDGAAACDFAFERMDHHMMGLHPVGDPLRAWASQDPAAAMAWFQKRKTTDGQLLDKQFGEWGRISEIRWIMGAWALVDPVEAARAYRGLETRAERQGARIGWAEGGKRAADRNNLLDAVWETPDNPDRGATDEVWTLLREWANHGPAELAAWIDSKDFDKSDSYMVSKAVLGSWLLEDQDAAIDWWINQRGSDRSLDHKLGQLVQAWSESDTFSAAEWLAGQELTDDHARAVQSLSQKLSQQDPERAFSWAEAITSDSARKSALRYAYRMWFQKNPDAAQAALDSLDVDESFRTSLAEAVKKDMDRSNTTRLGR